MREKRKETRPPAERRKDHFRRAEDGTRWKSFRSHVEEKEDPAAFTRQQLTQSEMLLHEEAGFLEVDKGEKSWKITQGALRNAVDITSATKSFDLSLEQFGPYRLDYTTNGRHLVIGGRVGHLACFDWVTKKLFCEINVMEEIYDVSWLHQETMLATAQKDWVYIYDNQGIELHCIKRLHRILRLQFLPYHFLLVAASDRGYLNWLDVSIGKMVATMPTHRGRLNVMCQNPYNAVTILGHSQGTVTMWSPNVREPLVSMLCHPRPIRGVTVDETGTYMATIATDSSVKIWDVRNYKCLQCYRIPSCANHVSFSQRNLLAVAMGNMLQIYKDCCIQSVSTPYLSHAVGKPIAGIKFCPYEDVLGIGHEGGFSSILVPGAGEPNFDALERNPFQTKSQRRETEVKSLLEKIPPELIVLDPNKVNQIDTSESASVAQNSSETVPKLRKEEIRSKKSSTVDAVRRKQAIRDEQKRKLKRTAVLEMAEKQNVPKETTVHYRDVLDRFRPKPL